MKSLKENFQKTHIVIIGSGIIGKFNALELLAQGYKITLLDNAEHKNSSNAALGLLMGEIYQKNSGRSWELRKKSMVASQLSKRGGTLNCELTGDRALIGGSSIRYLDGRLYL